MRAAAIDRDGAPRDPARGRRIRGARTAAGLKQREVADLVDVQPQQVHRWETGQGIGGETLSRLAEALQVSERWIMSGEGPGPAAELEGDPPYPALAAYMDGPEWATLPPHVQSRLWSWRWRHGNPTEGVVAYHYLALALLRDGAGSEAER